jgi:hypothetical protein
MDTNAIMLMRYALVFPIFWKEPTYIHTCVQVRVAYTWKHTASLKVYRSPCLATCSSAFRWHYAVSSPVVLNTTLLPRTKTLGCTVSRMPVVSSVPVELCRDSDVPLYKVAGFAANCCCKFEGTGTWALQEYSESSVCLFRIFCLLLVVLLLVLFS